MGYVDEKNEKTMGATFGEIPNWNNDLGNTILTYSDYWRDFSSITQNLKMPVLFYYGKKDWMVGPEHYKLIQFPEVMLWISDVGHMPFLENQTDLEKAIKSFNTKYNF
jgi:proline iminopeptidase